MLIAFDFDIDAPVEAVWSLLDDDEKMTQWMTGLIETSYPEGRDRASPVGTRFRQKIREGGRTRVYDGEVTAYEPRRLLAVRLEMGSAGDIDASYRLEARGEGTRLHYRADMTLKSVLGQILGRLFRPLTVSIVRRHMANLKRLAEEGAPGAG